jgi:hypothetical protein
MAYRAYLKGPLSFSMSRTKEVLVKLKFGMLLDTSRVASDMAAQFIRQL